MSAATNARAELKRDQLTLVTGAGSHVIEIEVAETAEQKALGLMFRRSLAPNAGMLFPYGEPQELTMWMKNTYISLDMVFIRADGTVHHIAEGTEPFSETVISSRGDVTAVLELIAGSAARLGLKSGDKVLHAHFGTAKGKGQR